MSEPKMSIDAMNRRLSSTAYGAWLGMQILDYRDDLLILEVPWRAEFSGTPDNDNIHGGVLAAVLDSAGSYALAAHVGKPLYTIDLRIDYHRPVGRGTMRVEARVIRAGRRMATAEASIYNSDDKLAASGRGLYVVP